MGSAPSGKVTAHECRLVAALALVATYAFFHSYLPPFKRVHLFSDIEGYHYPLQRYAFDSLKEGRVPLWDPSIYCGISYAGNLQAALLYPPTWLMYAASWAQPRLPFKSLEIFMFAHVWLAFVLCYLWLRGRRLDKLPCALGAAVFAYGGYMVRWLGHVGVISGLAWMPLGFWGIDEAVEKHDWRPLWKVALASAMSFLAGYPASWIVHCGMIGVYALAGRGRWRAAAGAVAGIAVSVVLVAVELLPALDARKLMMLEPTYGTGVAGWALLASYLFPNWFDFNPLHPPAFEPGGWYLYLGLPALFAIGWAVRRGQLRLHAQALACLAFAFFMANPPGFFVSALERFGLFENTARPYNFYEGVAPMAALITAVGLHDFLTRKAKRRLPRPVALVIPVGLGLWFGRQFWHGLHSGVFRTGLGSAAELVLALLLFSLALWSLREAAGRRRAWLAAALLLAVGIDFKVFGTRRQFNAIEGDVDTYQAAYGIGGVNDTAYREMLAHREYRVAVDESAGPAPTDFRMWGLATPEGFDPFLPAAYRELIERWTPFRTNRLFYVDVSNDEMMQALGVRYVLIRRGFASEERLASNPAFRLVGSGESFCRVYEYLKARPPYGWEDPRAGAVEMLAWAPERREFRVRSPQGGRFTLVEQFFPGWTASVDGRPMKVERWRGTFQAVSIGPGEHRLRFEFRPRSLETGAVVSLAACAGLALVVAADTRKRRRTQNG